MQQLQTATGLNRDQLNRMFRHAETLAPQSILIQVKEAIPRPGKRGVPSIYKLGETGAEILRAKGDAEAHACGLHDSTPIAHGRVTLEVRLAAQAAGLPVLTETELPYGDGQVLRPDNLITLPNGVVALFETEQTASYNTLRRIRDSGRHKVAFFNSAAGKQVSSTVRVLINLPYGAEWNRSVGIWERAMAMVAEENGGNLPFQIVAQPLYGFVDAPDWADPPAGHWESLFDPGQTATFAPEPTETAMPLAKTEKPPRKAAKPQLPAELRRHTAADDRRLIEAYWQYFEEHSLTLACSADHPHADPEFFNVMQIIYTASHPAGATPWELAQHPHLSLYLLRKYLELHPLLKLALEKAIGGRSSRIIWNPTMVFHRLQIVVDRFLEYHGLRVSPDLEVYPTSNYNRLDNYGAFRIEATLKAEVLLGARDGVIPLRDEVRGIEKALAWVIWALLAYSKEVGLKLNGDYPPFW